MASISRLYTSTEATGYVMRVEIARSNPNVIYGNSWMNLTTSTLNGMTISDMTHQLGTDGGIYLIGGYGKVFYRNNTMSDWTAYATGLPLALNNEISR